MKKREKGFTLVELLIVIIIIGILAGMMMLSTGSATDKAEAVKVVNNLRVIKTAVLMYYADNGKWPVESGDTMDIGRGTPSSLDKYLDTIPNGYYVNYSTKIYAACDGNSTEPPFTDTTGAGKVLKTMAEQASSPIWTTGAGDDFDVAMDIKK